METGRADKWKNNLDAHAFLNTFINCAAADNREYFRDVIQTYNDVLNDGKLLCNVTETMKAFFSKFPFNNFIDKAKLQKRSVAPLIPTILSFLDKVNGKREWPAKLAT